MGNSKRSGRVLDLRAQIIALFTSLLLSSIALAALAEENTKTSSASANTVNVSSVFGELESLVKEYYPKAKIVRTDNTLHFEYKARGLTGTQSGLKELSPDSGGVAGDVMVKPGRYAGRERNPSETNLILHMVFFTAPYSEPDDRHLFTRLSYPPDASVDFLSRFKTIIADQKKGVQELAEKPAAPAAKPAPAEVNSASTAQPAASSVQTPQAVQTVPAESKAPETVAAKEPPKVSFGARKLSKYSYPEGRFKILLPGNPNCRYGNTLGMRSVDYSYPESHGAYMISYLIAPGAIIDSKISGLLDAVCTNLSKTTKSIELKRNSLTLQGFQGRQIELAPKEGKEQLARFRLYVVRRFVYIIGAAGNKAWVDSPVVADYLNSLEVVPELTAAEAYAASQKAYAKKREEDKRAFEERLSKSRMEHQEASSKARKDFERSQADWKFRRF
ncbi:MAG TPA: hypothetical protein PKZ32_07230 [Candidatus Melainabacteria bacterium]|nr:hypothetical protein [Candidatus Melainabacteria bacterium]